MSNVSFYLILGIAIFLLGLHGTTLLHNRIRQIIAINVMGGGVFMVLVALASRVEPIDPVLQALVVTGLVVAVSATAFALRLSTAQARISERPPRTRSKEQTKEDGQE